MLRHQKSQGFTLIELVVVIILLSILIGSGMFMLTESFQAAFLTRDLSNANWQGRLAFERMSRDIRSIKLPTGLSMNVSNDSITFTDTDKLITRYNLSGTILVRNDISNNVLSDVASGITSLNFYPYNAAGIRQAGVDANTLYIQILLTATEGNTNVNLQTVVYPPNFTK